MSELKNIIDIIFDRHRIKPSFTEKDIYITEILKIMSELNHDKIIPVFAGGTALHKGHKIIKRFSEDIDFRAKIKSATTRAERSDIKYYIISKINKIPNLKVIDETVRARNENNFFGFYVEYPKTYSPDKSLRDNLKFEMSFEELLLDTVECEIDSIIDSLTKKSDKSFKINCISLEETAGNKLSALMWRVQIKDRTQQIGIKNDPTIIRHLHDLSALKNQVLKDSFIIALARSFNNDLGRGGSSKNISLSKSMENTVKSLKNDKIYRKEYENFVYNMCYGKDEELIEFNMAIKDLEEIAEFIFSSKINNGEIYG